MVDPKHRNAPSYRNVPLFYEYFLGQGMFLKLNKISLIRAKLQECCCSRSSHCFTNYREVNKENHGCIERPLLPSISKGSNSCQTVDSSTGLAVYTLVRLDL